MIAWLNTTENGRETWRNLIIYESTEFDSKLLEPGYENSTSLWKLTGLIFDVISI